MQIQSHSLQLASERNYNRSEEQQEQLRIARVSQDTVSGMRQVDTLVDVSQSERHEWLTYSASMGQNDRSDNVPAETRAQALAQTIPAEASATATATATEAPFALRLEAEDQFKLDLISRLHKAITGKEIRLQLVDMSMLRSADAGGVETMQQPSSAPQPASEPELGLEYQRHLRINEREATHFEARGEVITRDGRRIDISLSLQMARSVTQEEHEILRTGARLSDPLVINFDGDAAQLSQTRFEFDLDLDGLKDQVPMLAGNRAFLALDSNNDGHINNGSELFGARSGNGFAELAEFDADGNGFIDAGDPVFDRLRLWSPGAEGKGSLVTLGSANIGAIWLNATDTEFSLGAGMTENRLGVIRSSSIFLSEDSRVGTVQHVDLSI
jgi:hypothetical protein